MKNELYIQIRNKIKELIFESEWEGHVFCVGGCVRDEIMGNEIKDIDMLVDLRSKRALHCSTMLFLYRKGRDGTQKSQTGTCRKRMP